MNEIKHLQVSISGKVQGVFFRKYILGEAARIGVYGFVMNKPDGTVYIEAEGDQAALDLLLVSCKKGSPQSQVERTDIVFGTVKGFASFVIK